MHINDNTFTNKSSAVYHLAAVRSMTLLYVFCTLSTCGKILHFPGQGQEDWFQEIPANLHCSRTAFLCPVQHLRTRILVRTNENNFFMSRVVSDWLCLGCHHRYGSTLLANCELGSGELVTVSYYWHMILWHATAWLCRLLWLSLFLGSSEKIENQVFFAVIIGSTALGNSLPEFQTFAAALGSATSIYAVLDRVSVIM